MTHDELAEELHAASTSLMLAVAIHGTWRYSTSMTLGTDRDRIVCYQLPEEVWLAVCAE